MPMTRRECRTRDAHGIRTNKNTRGLIIKGPICHSGTPAKDDDLQAQDYGRTSASAASGGVNQDFFFPPRFCSDLLYQCQTYLLISQKLRIFISQLWSASLKDGGLISCLVLQRWKQVTPHRRNRFHHWPLYIQTPPPSPFTSPAAAPPPPSRLPHFDMHVSRQSDK